MRKFVTALALAAAAAALALGPVADAAPDRRDPYTGYVFPAGGQRGTTFVVTAGGQNLYGVKAAHVTGKGVHAKIIRHLRPLSRKQQGELRRQIAEGARRLRAAKSGKPRKAKRGDKSKLTREKVELPDHPLLKNVPTMNAEQLRHTAVRFLGAGNKRQPNTQIGETVEVEITIERTAPPGNRELRLLTPRGLTNPARFRVGVVPEINEDEHLELGPPESDVLDVPVLVNGQILPGDTDRFRFRAKKGRRLVIRTEARSLAPYLADAVPGWFQAVTTLYDADGREVAFADDWRYDPDPTLLFEVPRTGEYMLAIRDSIHRGREDFVYRVSIADTPFVTGLFPLGGPLGIDTTAHISGWNLPAGRMSLDTDMETGSVTGTRWTQTAREGRRSNRVPYVVSSLPECLEKVPAGDEPGTPQQIRVPCVINGRVEIASDVDVYAFRGRAGEEIVAEVIARRLHSPMDSLLRLTDAEGTVIAWNDDHEGGGSGLLTHHADSWLRVKLPLDAVYHLRISDAQRHGGPEYGYRLRVSEPRPDFEVFLTPSSLSLRAGRAVPVELHAVRRDGFQGEIDVALVGGPAGFLLGGASIPAGRDSVRMTLTAPGASFDGPVELELAARADVSGERIEHRVVPADDMMQAFIYQHLTPAERLVVAVRGARRTPPSVKLDTPGRIRIPLGGTADVRIVTPGRKLPGILRLVLDEPPPGIVIMKRSVEAGALVLQFRATAGVEGLEPGFADNLIIQGYVDQEVKPKNGKGRAKRQRSSYGYLPAIPIEIVER